LSPGQDQNNIFQYEYLEYLRNFMLEMDAYYSNEYSRHQDKLALASQKIEAIPRDNTKKVSADA